VPELKFGPTYGRYGMYVGRNLVPPFASSAV
jgi:hypothetical protein